MKTKNFMSLKNEVLELLGNENMLAIRGGFTDKQEINSQQTCAVINNGNNCSAINVAAQCILINDSQASCSLINNINTCTTIKNP